MTIKELKRIFATANDTDKIEIVNGEIKLVEEKPIEYKFNIGDKVTVEKHDNLIFEVIKQKVVEGIPAYELKHNDLITSYFESYIKPYIPQDITERIKTFEDTCEWCKENKPYLYLNWKDYFDLGEGDEDIVAYLKLRIITCALNEGWEPTFEEDETRYYPYSYIDTDNLGVDYEVTSITFPLKLCFKTPELAQYAAKQFRGIYADFCGVKKGGDQ